MAGMLTEGLKEGNYSEIDLDGTVCRMYKDGKIECKAEGEEEFTPRGAPTTDLPPLGDLNITL